MNNLEKLINDAKEEFNEAWHEPDVYQPKLESFDDWLTQKLTQAYNQGKEDDIKVIQTLINTFNKVNDPEHVVSQTKLLETVLSLIKKD